MKSLIAIFLCVSSFAQDRPGVKILPIPCSVNHEHQTSDCRIAIVRVTGIISCGFTYEDLGDQSISMDPILFDASDPGLTRLVASATFERQNLKLLMHFQQPVKGAIGILVYCSHCRAGFLIKVEK